MFGRKKKIRDIFDDLPKAPEGVTPAVSEPRRSGKRAMLIPDTPYTDDPAADLLLANTGKQREDWLEILFASAVREGRQSELVNFLQSNYRVQKWWANSIALMYLKWRSQPKSVAAEEKLLRLTASIPTGVGLSYNLFSAGSIYGDNFNRFLKLQPDEKIVLTFNDQTRVSIIFEPVGANTSLIIEHEFLNDATKIREAKKYWQQLINKLVEQVSR